MKTKAPQRKFRAEHKEDPAVPSYSDEKFLIAAVGASAGGLEAYSDLIRYLSEDTGIAFVVVQHLDPKHHSILTELLGRHTRMSVMEVTDGMRVEPNRIYVIPPNTTMSIADHTLKLVTREEAPGAPMVIDRFMRSLAEAHGDCAVGIILSGSGTDGTLGMAEIQAQGGVTFAQDEHSAKYDGMPRSAIAAGNVDYVLPPQDIARELARIAKHPYGTRQIPESGEPVPAESVGINAIFQLLRRNAGVDFTHYRKTTILRRIQRRMVVHKLDKLDEYVKYLQAHPAEIKALYQDMLITVTSFFRNAGVFEALKTSVFPNLLKDRTSEIPIRIWTSGCASGEETYSVAMVLLEYLGDKAQEYTIQLFGSDVSETSIAKARSGIYPDNIQTDVSPERLRRFFTTVDNGYCISKNIRDMCIFAQHNLLGDPPFSQMDIICCRNLLIYMEPVLQNKMISLFHYALRSGGYLILGTSEGLGSATNLFSAEDRTHKIFSKKSTALRQVVNFSLDPQPRADFGSARLTTRQLDTSWNYTEAQKEFDRRLINQFSPATAFTNEDFEIVHTRGNVSRYLKLTPGRASLNILRMVREGLLLDLRNALGRAKKENATVRQQNVTIKNGDNGGPSSTHSPKNRLVDFEVVPIVLGSVKERYFMVVFRDSLAGPARKPARGKVAQPLETSTARLGKLEQELAATKEYLQSVIETHEATNEELQSANEEILSSNEELQSTNEELETAKEELQSANEELTTVNDELRNRNMEVNQINNDLSNLLSSIDIAVVMVGHDLSVRRFTPRAQKVLGLIPADLGRPLQNINAQIDITDLPSMVLQVTTSLRSVEKEIADRKGGKLLLRILPYRMAENKIDGAVLTLQYPTVARREGAKGIPHQNLG
jgi:two-component system CheB/CheR fusion protein